MPFFKFKYATEGIGRAYPQSESFGQSVDYRHPESIRSLRLKSTSTFHLHTIKLVKSAKITDVISSVANKVFGTIVSDRFVEILSEYRCSDLDIHSLKLEKDSNFSYGYNYIKFNQDSFNSVDNKKSQFQLEIKNDVFEFANMSNDEFQFYFRDGKLKEGRYEGKLYNFTNYTIGEIVLLDNFNYDFFSCETSQCLDLE